MKELIDIIKVIKAKTRGAAWIGIGAPKTHKVIDISREEIEKMNEVLEIMEGDENE